MYFAVLAYYQNNPMAISPKKSDYFHAVGGVGLLAFPGGKHGYQELAYKNPHPCSWPLHGFSSFYTAILVIVILLRLFTFVHHWHHIRARRIWLAYEVGPCADFADMRSFYLLVIRLCSCLTLPKETSFHFITRHD